MNNKNMLAVAAVAVIAVLGVGYSSGMFNSADKNAEAQKGPTVKVVVPKFGQIAKLGEDDFNANCAACHGKNAAGTGNGPPLIHRVYVSNHHADAAFTIAARNGVRSHHWGFGNMPPQPQVKDFELVRIVAYIRELQKANGIF